MLKKTYKILRHIHRNPNITKEKLNKNFADFEKYHNTISDYVNVVDENIDYEQLCEEKYILDAEKRELNISESAKYVENKMQGIKNVTDDTLIYYSTNLKFDEYCEKKRHDALLFWVPYTITTVLAIASLFLS